MKKSKKKVKPEKELIEVDPIFPIVVVPGSKPVVRNNEGREIFKDKHLKVIELPYRAFFVAWELVEKRAAENYTKYHGTGALERIAQANLELVLAFRNAALEGLANTKLEPLSDKEAAKLREKWIKAHTKPSQRSKKDSGASDTTKKAPKGSPGEIEAPESKSEGAICGEKHKIDGKVRKCRRKPDHSGKHKDVKGNRW